jgi:glutamate decarboxylase
MARAVEALGPFELITRGDQLPVFAFTAYTFPAERTDLSVLRVVVRNGFSHDLAALLVEDLTRLLPELARQPGPFRSPEEGPAFHH